MARVRIAGLTTNQAPQVQNVASMMEVSGWIHRIATREAST